MSNVLKQRFSPQTDINSLILCFHIQNVIFWLVNKFSNTFSGAQSITMKKRSWMTCWQLDLYVLPKFEKVGGSIREW